MSKGFSITLLLSSGTGSSKEQQIVLQAGTWPSIPNRRLWVLFQRIMEGSKSKKKQLTFKLWNKETMLNFINKYAISTISAAILNTFAAVAWAFNLYLYESYVSLALFLFFTLMASCMWYDVLREKE